MNEPTDNELGFQRFTYSKDHVKSIFELLKCNRGKPSRVFSIVWDMKMFHGQENMAPLILDLIERVQQSRVENPSLNLDEIYFEMHKGFNGMAMVER